MSERVVLTREEYEAILRALREAVDLAREAVRQRDELLRKLKRLERREGGRDAG